jgi:hypothetical protein
MCYTEDQNFKAVTLLFHEYKESKDQHLETTRRVHPAMGVLSPLPAVTTMFSGPAGNIHSEN